MQLRDDADPGHGFTELDPLPPTIQTEVICDGNAHVWRARVSVAAYGIIEHIGTPINLLTSEAVQSADCLTLEQMMEDLEYVMSHAANEAERDDFWLPDGFIKAHEDVHVRLIREFLDDHLSDLVEAIESITRPCDEYSQEEAAADMDDEIQDQIALFMTALRDFYGTHDPADAFTSVHQQILGPWADMVDAAGLLLGCW